MACFLLPRLAINAVEGKITFDIKSMIMQF